jgi:predicted dehydrogenase
LERNRPERRLRLALLGLGAAARSIHWPACRRLEGVEVVAGADPDPRAREAFRLLAPRPTLYDDAAELLRAEKPDWVVVAAPPFAHRSLSLLALEHGSHVFCEKPLATAVADADALIEAARRAGRWVAVNLEFPRMPIFEAAQRAIGSREFGRLLFLQAWQHLREADSKDPGWRSSGRTLEEFGTHVVDLAIRLFGGPPERVEARMPRVSGPPEADLIDLVTLEFPDGRAASIVLDRVCRGSHRYLELRLDGEVASLRASIGGRARLSFSIEARSRRPSARLELAGGGQAWLEIGERRRILARNPRDAFADATSRHLDSVLEAVARGLEPPASARRARDVVAVVEAAYASAATGRSVSIAPPPEPR